MSILPILERGTRISAVHYGEVTRTVNDVNLRTVRSGSKEPRTIGLFRFLDDGAAPQNALDRAVNDRVRSSGALYSSTVWRAQCIQVMYDEDTATLADDFAYGPLVGPDTIDDAGDNLVYVYFPLFPKWLASHGMNANPILNSPLFSDYVTASWSRSRNRWESDWVPPMSYYCKTLNTTTYIAPGPAHDQIFYVVLYIYPQDTLIVRNLATFVYNTNEFLATAAHPGPIYPNCYGTATLAADGRLLVTGLTCATRVRGTASANIADLGFGTLNSPVGINGLYSGGSLTVFNYTGSAVLAGANIKAEVNFQDGLWRMY